jgi:hypothetical protein
VEKAMKRQINDNFERRGEIDFGGVVFRSHLAVICMETSGRAFVNNGFECSGTYYVGRAQ